MTHLTRPLSVAEEITIREDADLCGIDPDELLRAMWRLHRGSLNRGETCRCGAVAQGFDRLSSGMCDRCADAFDAEMFGREV